MLNSGCMYLDIIIQRLSKIDAPLVNDSCRYKSAFSLGRTLYQIEHLPSFGAYRDGQLVSWCLTQFSGYFGMMFTLSEVRRLGIASLVNASLASELFKFQEHVFCYVLFGNKASYKMLEKLGYRQTCIIDWLTVTSK
ncbi:unnamed protein product [Rotaria sp. Silwood1]|nr:unnamed protein product [Rotaria sp. Silwood1]